MIVTGVGGGGFIAGLAFAIKTLSTRKIKIIGVEPEGAASMYLSMKRGEAVKLDAPPKTIAAGLAPPYAGKTCYDVVKNYVEEIVLVSDAEIKEAMAEYYITHKLVAEPSGAAALAAVLSGKVDVKACHVVCVLSGGNVHINDLVQFIAS